MLSPADNTARANARNRILEVGSMLGVNNWRPEVYVVPGTHRKGNSPGF